MCISVFVTDMVYRHNTTFDNVTTEVEILDSCKCSVSDFFQFKYKIMIASAIVMELAGTRKITVSLSVIRLITHLSHEAWILLML